MGDITKYLGRELKKAVVTRGKKIAKKTKAFAHGVYDTHRVWTRTRLMEERERKGQKYPPYETNSDEITAYYLGGFTGFTLFLPTSGPSSLINGAYETLKAKAEIANREAD